MKNLLVVVLLLSMANAMASSKVGIVNFQKVISEIKEGKSILKTLEKSYNDKKKILKAEEDKIKTLQGKYKKQSMVLSDKAKLKKEQELKEMIYALQKKTVSYQKEMQKQEAELKKPIMKKLQVVIDKVSNDEKVDLTFEISTSPVVFAANKIDLTGKVIKAYDKKYNK